MSSQNPIIVTLPHDGEAFEDFLSCVLDGLIRPKSETGQRLLARLISLCRLAFDYSSASILKKGLYCIQNSFMDLKDMPDLTGLVKQLLDLATDIDNIPMKAKLRYIIAFKNRTLLSSEPASDCKNKSDVTGSPRVKYSYHPHYRSMSNVMHRLRNKTCQLEVTRCRDSLQDPAELLEAIDVIMPVWDGCIPCCNKLRTAILDVKDEVMCELDKYFG
ncbi:hypothetical protein M422DRAFT_251509 [Sphaerobolus stellatus SS14]|uniref:Uncharacterized protein n=1 Tax=Sphaerobolus stellatus (strain SS14) TaxID=990650 RepID=A0A0C9W0G0_SPHS4|nr:hypothetical protein M422DRAFT_251509 [Sphaerobolus stellatus SS14]